MGKRYINIDAIVIVSVLSAVAAVGRIAFAALPNVTPSSYIVIVTGLGLGAIPGMSVGIISAAASNLVLGQGPWTLFQMIGWGLMGLCAGLLRGILRNAPLMGVYGAVMAYVFGAIMNAQWYILGGNAFGLSAYITSIVVSFPLDTMHAASNAVLLVVAGSRAVRALTRIKRRITQTHVIQKTEDT